jgi:hypothetical protein
MDVGRDLQRPDGEMTEEQRRIMFGQTGAMVGEISRTRSSS